MPNNVIDSGMNSVVPPVSKIVVNSPDHALHVLAGQLVTKAVAITGGAGAKIYNCFTVSGTVELLGLWGIFTDATNTTGLTVVSFQIQDDGAVVVPLTAAAGVDCSMAAAGSSILMAGVAADAAAFLDANTVVMSQVAGLRQLQGAILTGCYTNLNTIQFLVTQNAAADADILFYCAWRSLHTGSSVVPV